MELNIQERLNAMLSYKQQSREAILRWKKNVPMDEAMKAIEAIGKAYDEGFVIDDDNRFVYENLVKWVHGDDSMVAINPDGKGLVGGKLKSGILLAGTIGSGKSLCLEVVKAYASIVGAQIQIYPNDIKNLSWIGWHATQICDRYSSIGNIEGLNDVDILHIEDLGCEPSSVSYMGNKTDVMARLLEYRGDFNNRLTMITTNLPLNSDVMEERYGMRVVSRLKKLNYFVLKGKDRR